MPIESNIVGDIGLTISADGIKRSEAMREYTGMRSHLGIAFFIKDAMNIVGIVTIARVTESATAVFTDVDATTTGASSKPPTKTGLRVMMPLNLCRGFVRLLYCARFVAFLRLKIHPP